MGIPIPAWATTSQSTPPHIYLWYRIIELMSFFLVETRLTVSYHLFSTSFTSLDSFPSIASTFHVPMFKVPCLGSISLLICLYGSGALPFGLGSHLAHSSTPRGSHTVANLTRAKGDFQIFLYDLRACWKHLAGPFWPAGNGLGDTALGHHAEKTLCRVNPTSEPRSTWCDMTHPKTSNCLVPVSNLITRGSWWSLLRSSRVTTESVWNIKAELVMQVLISLVLK